MKDYELAKMSLAELLLPTVERLAQEEPEKLAKMLTPEQRVAGLTPEQLAKVLTPEQRTRAMFPLESPAWRQWSNIQPFLMRHGVSLDEMTPVQRGGALALLGATLSATARDTARDVMRLNELVRLITGSESRRGLPAPNGARSVAR